MTETIPHTQQAQKHVAAADQLSGVDLARVALHQAREAAKARGASGGTQKSKRAPRPTSTRRDGREPAGFGAVLHMLLADRAWDLPAAGGNVLDRWPDIADAVTADLSAHVTATGFHPETGQLDLRPDSSAYATQLRLLSPRIIIAANTMTGRQTVRTIRVRSVAQTTVPQPRPATPAPSATVPEVSLRTRDMAPAGFHRALAAHQAVPRKQVVPLDITKAAAWQTHALRELSQWAFPDSTDEHVSREEASLQDRRREFAATETAALKRARAERGQRKAMAAQRPEDSASQSTPDPL